MMPLTKRLLSGPGEQSSGITVHAHRGLMGRPNQNVVNGCGIAIAAAVVVGILILPFMWVSVPKGNVGVVSSFGSVSDQTLPAGGPYLVAPWKAVYRMDCQTQKDEEPATVPTNNGLSVTMKATLLYRLRPDRAASLARDVGHEKYQERVVTPYFKNAVRDVTAEFTPDALYTAERQKVEGKVLERVRQELDRHGFEVEAVMLLDPVLPDVVKQRIEAKVAAEQDAIRMTSVFKQREQEGMANKRVKELDAEAKVIEAKGIADAQAIIKKDLDHNYLVYLWIEALKESAKHNNATIYVPTGGDGMPLFKAAGPGGK